MARDPAAARQELRLLIECIGHAPELTTAQQANLRHGLEQALASANRAPATKDLHDRHRHAAQAGALDQRRVLDRVARDQEVTRQLTDRYQALIDEGRYVEAEHVAANEVTSATSRMVCTRRRNCAETRGNIATALAYRTARSKAVLATFNAEHNASIPMSGDQPIIYPDADRWRELTEWRRRQVPVDNHRVTAAEARIKRRPRRNDARRFRPDSAVGHDRLSPGSARHRDPVGPKEPR